MSCLERCPQFRSVLIERERGSTVYSSVCSYSLSIHNRYSGSRWTDATHTAHVRSAPELETSSVDGALYNTSEKEINLVANIHVLYLCIHTVVGVALCLLCTCLAPLDSYTSENCMVFLCLISFLVLLS